MLILGVTGSIGSGKSHFCKKLARLRGIKILSSDKMVHNLYADKIFARKLIDIFGNEIKTPSFDGATPRNNDLSQVSCRLHDGICKSDYIDRQKLGKIVFKDPKKKKQLEEIVYPELAKQRADLIKLLNRQHFKGILVLEIPLLFENILEQECDLVLTVFCNPIIQKQRVFKRQGMTEEKYNNILKVQMPVHEKIKRSDLTYNSGSLQSLAFRLKQLLAD